MRCPTCLSVMRCISEIHNIPGQPGRQRMDLYCFNRENDNERKRNRCRVACHMGVITNDPHLWQCHDYSFGFIHGQNHYTLHGQDYSVDPYHQGHRLPLTTLYSDGQTLLYVPSFMPISTGDNMHEEAWELFHRLRKLVIFT